MPIVGCFAQDKWQNASICVLGKTEIHFIARPQPNTTIKFQTTLAKLKPQEDPGCSTSYLQIEEELTDVQTITNKFVEIHPPSPQQIQTIQRASNSQQIEISEIYTISIQPDEQRHFFSTKPIEESQEQIYGFGELTPNVRWLKTSNTNSDPTIWQINGFFLFQKSVG